MTSSRQSARPIATRSEIWRTFEIRVPAASTVADRSASNRRAIVRAGGGGADAAAGRAGIDGHRCGLTVSVDRPGA